MWKEPKEKDSIVICWILRILGIISNVCVALCIGVIAFFMVGLGVVAGSIKTEKGQIKLYDEVITYSVEKNNSLKFAYNEESTVLSDKMLKEINKDLEAKDVVKFIDGLSVTKLLVLLESILFIGLVTLFITFAIIKKSVRVLKNTIRERTPLVKSNVNDLLSVANLYIIIWAFSTLGFAVLELAYSNFTGLSIGSASSLIPAFIFYLVAWTISCGINNGVEEIEEKPKTTRKRKTVEE